MKLLKAGILTLGILGIAACDREEEALLGVGGIGGGTDAITSSALDPNSMVYFDQEIGNTVLFPVDQAILTPEATSILLRQVGWLTDRPSMTIQIEGHADEQGTREYNLALGARRANSVQNFLISNGIEASRIQTISYGKERPLEICSDEACWAKNRRSVTVVTGGFSS